MIGQVQAKQARLNQECVDLMDRGQRVNQQADELLQLIREEEARDRDYKLVLHQCLLCFLTQVPRKG